MSALIKAISSFLSVYQPIKKGINQEGTVTYEFEQYTLYNNNHRIHIIVESKLEDLDKALQDALDAEDYHLADRINDLINQRKGLPPEETLDHD